MISKRKFRHKPIYKKLTLLRKNVQNRSKLFKFKRRKWVFLLLQLSRISKTDKRNCYYKFYDQNVYYVPKYNNFFSRNFKQNLDNKRSFKLFYGNLLRKNLKKNVKIAKILSSKVRNEFHSRTFFKELYERRLDVIIVRSHLALSIMNARQLISHGHVFINNSRVNDASIIVNEGDVITFSKKSHKLLEYYILNSDLWPLPPKHLQISYKLLQIQVIGDVKLTNDSSVFSTWLNVNTLMESYRH